MLRTPSRRKTVRLVKRLNLVPILDAVFIFIFFLLMSTSFIKIFEIQSDVPLISDKEPPKKNERPLALTLSITDKSIAIHTGVPSRFLKKFDRMDTGEFDLMALHDFLVQLKFQNEKNKTEKDCILEPKFDIEYDELVKIMDAVRLLKKTDPELYVKDPDGIEKREMELFNNIIFGNIQS